MTCCPICGDTPEWCPTTRAAARVARHHDGCPHGHTPAHDATGAWFTPGTPVRDDYGTDGTVLYVTSPDEDSDGEGGRRVILPHVEVLLSGSTDREAYDLNPRARALAGQWPDSCLHGDAYTTTELHVRTLPMLVDQANALGYRVELVRYCESSDSPGLPGAGRGVILYAQRLIRLRADQSTRALAETLAHEIEHAKFPNDGERIDHAWASR